MRVLVAGLIGFSIFVLSSAITVILIIALAGRDASTEDVGDIFVKADAVATYANERLVAASNAAELPDPPVMLANQTALRVALAGTLAFNVGLFLVVGIGSGLSFTDLTRKLGLRSYDPTGILLAAGAVFACYLGIGIYSLLISRLGIEYLIPNSTVPRGVLRDPAALAFTGVLACLSAPFVEELFYRGFVFGGLLRWGFWPAAAISAFVFTLSHFDLGSIIPFFFIGLVMAALFRFRGSLWNSIVFHVLFNSTSFVILLSSR